MPITMWTYAEGQAEVLRVQMAVRAFGYHVAMGGGVLNKGQSSKDLDLYFLPLDNGTQTPNANDLRSFLETRWGQSTPINDPAYGLSPHYRLKLKFMPTALKRIDVFVIGG